MTPNQLISVGLGVIAVALVAAAAAGILTLVRHRVEDEHPGAQEGVPTLAPLDSPTLVDLPPTRIEHRPVSRAQPVRPAGRHHEDTVHIVPLDWTPPPAELQGLEEAIVRARSEQPTGLIPLPPLDQGSS